MLVDILEELLDIDPDDEFVDGLVGILLLDGLLDDPEDGHILPDLGCRLRVHVLEVERGDREDIVDHDPDLGLGILLVEDDDTAVLFGLGGLVGDMESLLEVNDGGDLAAEVDDPLDVGRGVGQFGDRRVFDDLLDIEEVDGEMFLPEEELDDLEGTGTPPGTLYGLFPRLCFGGSNAQN